MNIKTIFKIIGNAIRETYSQKVWKWLTGGLTTIIAVLLLAKNFLQLPVELSICIGISFYIVTFFAFFLPFLCRNSFMHIHQTYQESKYGDAIVLLKKSLSEINDLKRKDVSDTESIVSILNNACDSLKEIFDKKTNSTCSASIKVQIMGDITGETSVKNICRDKDHVSCRDSANYQAIDHTIIGNTAFQMVVNNVLRRKKCNYYINNDIPGSRDYENTSSDLYENSTLPYKSEIVVPILPTKNLDMPILGFLCIDSNQKNKFDTKYDPHIIESIADGIYDIIPKLNSGN